MKNIKVIRYQQRLDNLFSKIKLLPLDDFELQSHWARYLCILVSGFLETGIREIYTEYVNHKASPYIVNYVVNQLKSFQNPKMEKILQLTRCFSPEWEASLRSSTEGKLKDSIDSIVNIRHGIAHGEQTGITYHILFGYYKDAIKVMELIEEQCDNNTIAKKNRYKNIHKR